MAWQSYRTLNRARLVLGAKVTVSRTGSNEAAHLAELCGRDLLPAEVADRIMEGEHPLEVLREWRGVWRRQLAERADLL